MGPLDALWHLVNFFAVAVLMGMIAAALGKWLWRRELAAVGWRALALFGAAGASLAVIGGLVLFGRDGRIGTYAAMVVACALMLWWRGFVMGRRSPRR